MDVRYTPGRGAHVARITWSVRSGMAGLTMRYRAEVSGACWKAKGPEARDHRCRKKRDGETARTEAERKKGGSEKDVDKPRRCNIKSDKDRRNRREKGKREERKTYQATTIVASLKYCFPCQARRVCTNNDTSINVRIANHTAVY